MLRIAVILLIMVLMLPVSGRGQDPPPYRMGEQLFFDLSYGWIKGGEGTMQILPGEGDSTAFYHVKTEAHTTGIFAFFSPVKDTYETFFCRQEGYPVRSVREVWRGKRRSYEELLFLDDNHRVRSSRSGDHLFPVQVYDVLSAFYEARVLLKERSPDSATALDLPLFFDGRFFDLRVKYAGEEVIGTFMGRKTCYRFVPDTTGNRTFTDIRQLEIWIMKDEHLLPVKINARLPVGKLRCILTEVR